MKKNRGKNNERNLTDGPGKLAQALDITKKQYGVDLTRNSELFIIDGLLKRGKIIAAPRIGIKTALDNLWNFKILL